MLNVLNGLIHMYSGNGKMNKRLHLLWTDDISSCIAKEKMLGKAGEFRKIWSGFLTFLQRPQHSTQSFYIQIITQTNCHA